MIKDSLKEMELTPGTLVHVINTSLYKESGYWLAWKLSPEGHKVELKRYQVPQSKIYHCKLSFTILLLYCFCHRVKELCGDVRKLYERISLPIYGQ